MRMRKGEHRSARQGGQMHCLAPRANIAVQLMSNPAFEATLHYNAANLQSGQFYSVMFYHYVKN